jgi:branched-subunit amino acid transport protein
VPVVHQALGAFVVAINLIAGIWGLFIWRGRLRANRVFEQVLALSHTIIFGQALLGLLLLAGNYRAPVQLHYVYGLAPAVAVLFAYSSRTEDTRRNILVFAVIAILAGLLAGRAFMTGEGYG